ncbi:hypothetical protein CC1G_13211 [Coprinopsis cinerea okayama7|uniref:BZIP domain-containing protein n=1 Tax=Coprinopsis cinerea (strain Okayama-7 / 130 / ATCC MYA-4618 / FGSC 9003) TaxID=240176 RepID=A8N182_COPC7|nr:hypothetical protein CC1G_13211 [Coprinopsis cinerea okayama7\|eukprot:XP_001828631.2 hypothetical protein CC1G_13211 [Coprinopsis cinerea okayama7\
MDHDPSRSAQRNLQRSRSEASPGAAQSGGANRVNVQDAALLAQFAAAAGTGLDVSHGYAHGVPSTGYPNLGPSPGFYGSFYHHDSMSQPTSLPPLSSLDYPWPQLAPQQQHDLNQYSHSMEAGAMASSASTFIPSQYHPPLSMPHDSPSPPASVSGSSVRSSGGGRSRSGTNTEDLTEAERAAIAEEKRRRNTAASARFRIKKKQKTINLERSVSDLTGRAEELEREVADLRRENGWLKEIVMLKGTRFAAQRMALNQAAALAANGQLGPEGASSVTNGEGSYYHGDDGDEDSGSSDDDNERTSKGKGKAGSSKR